MKHLRVPGANLRALVTLIALPLLVMGCGTTDQNSGMQDLTNMYYVVESDKTFDQASADLDAAVKRHGFGVVQVHDLGTTLRKKGMTFQEECKVFEVCNPKQAAKVLSTDISLNMALPCRISVYTEGGKTKIGMIRPERMLAALSKERALTVVAKEVEAKTIQVIEDAKQKD